MASSSTEHADSEPRDIQLAKTIIAKALSMRPGKEKAISSQDLADRTPVKATTVRDLIPEIIAEYHIPIASCPNGYYRISDHDEFAREARRYESQRESAKRRLSTLAQAYYDTDQPEVIVGP